MRNNFTAHIDADLKPLIDTKEKDPGLEPQSRPEERTTCQKNWEALGSASPRRPARRLAPPKGWGEGRGQEDQPRLAQLHSPWWELPRGTPRAQNWFLRGKGLDNCPQRWEGFYHHGGPGSCSPERLFPSTSFPGAGGGPGKKIIQMDLSRKGSGDTSHRA